MLVCRYASSGFLALIAAATLRCFNAEALCRDPTANLDDLREAVAKLEDTERIARRVFGGAHPLTMGTEFVLGAARAALRARETPSAR